MVGAVHRVLLFKRMVWNMWIHVMLLMPVRTMPAGILVGRYVHLEDV
jgi:hypothetical protein